MKLIPLTLIITVLFFGFIQCRKNKWKAPKDLPPITQAGKNTFGCKVNGEIWVPYYQCAFGHDPCGALSATNLRLSQNQVPLEINIAPAIMYSDGTISSITIASRSNNGIASVGEKADSISVNFVQPGFVQYFTKPGRGANSFMITKLDTVNKILSGTFAFTLYKWASSDSVKITDGRFDVRFSACECSN